MVTIIDYMKNKIWQKDKFELKEIHYLNIARRDRMNNNIPSMIGSLLIYNQLIECEMKKIIELCVYLIKAKLYPTIVLIRPEIEDATFGKIISEFEKYLIDYDIEENLIKKIKSLNEKRIKIVHKVFSNKSSKILNLENDLVKAEEIIKLLLALHNKICNMLDTEVKKFESL